MVDEAQKSGKTGALVTLAFEDMEVCAAEQYCLSAARCSRQFGNGSRRRYGEFARRACGLDVVAWVRHVPRVSDVVCAICGGPALNDRSGGLLFLGKRWFFCSQACRIAFKREPERIASARPEAGVAVESASALPRTRDASPFKIR